MPSSYPSENLGVGQASCTVAILIETGLQVGQQLWQPKKGP